MHDIQMVDLKRQYQKIKPEVDKAIEHILTSATFINGPAVNQFAKDLEQYLGIKHVIPCANGTEALQIALMGLGVEPGDEVIAPSFTYIATVEVAALLGLKTVFVDVDKDTFNMNVAAVRKAISPKTKAIIPVHLYGQSVDMKGVLSLANEFGIPIIEDNAQAIGGHYIFPDGKIQKTGTMGLIGCTSFFPSKNLGAYGDGGAMFTNDDALADKLKMIANHGQKKRYYHDRVGLNSRLDSIQAAVLSIKLKHLDNYCNARRKAADYYDKAFAAHDLITTPFRADYAHHVFHQYTLQLDDKINREKFGETLSRKGIPSMIYYPVACHKQNIFSQRNNAIWELPNTEFLSPRVISLPIHTELTEVELKFIADSVLDAVENRM